MKLLHNHNVSGGLVKVFEEQRRVIKVKFKADFTWSALKEAEALLRMASDMESLAKSIREIADNLPESDDVKVKINVKELRNKFLVERKAKMSAGASEINVQEDDILYESDGNLKS